MDKQNYEQVSERTTEQWKYHQLSNTLIHCQYSGVSGVELDERGNIILQFVSISFRKTAVDVLLLVRYNGQSGDMHQKHCK